MEEAYKARQEMVEEYRRASKDQTSVEEKQKLNQMITTQVSDVATSRREQMRQESVQEDSRAQETKAETSSTTQSQTDDIATSAADSSNVSEPVQAKTSAIELRNARQRKQALQKLLDEEKAKPEASQNKSRIDSLTKEIEAIETRISMLQARVGA